MVGIGTQALSINAFRSSPEAKTHFRRTQQEREDRSAEYRVQREESIEQSAERRRAQSRVERRTQRS